MSLLSAFGSALVLVYSVHRVSGRCFGGLLAGGFFLTQNMTVLLWGPLHRVDLLALCLALDGLALAASGRVQPAVLPLQLAVLTKQTYLIAPLAVCKALYPEWRASFRSATLFAVGLAVAVVAAQVLTGGWFLGRTVVASTNPFEMDNLAAMLGAYLHSNGVPLLAANALFSLSPRPGERLWSLYFLGVVLTLPAIGKVGASWNYWLEVTAALAVLIGLLAHRLIAHPRRDHRVRPSSASGRFAAGAVPRLSGRRA